MGIQRAGPVGLIIDNDFVWIWENTSSSQTVEGSLLQVKKFFFLRKKSKQMERLKICKENKEPGKYFVRKIIPRIKTGSCGYLRLSQLLVSHVSV